MPEAIRHSDFGDLVETLVKYKSRWLTPAIVMAAIVAVYAVFKSDTWQISQAVIVRDDASVRTDELGEFPVDNPLKASVETIHEVGASQSVLLGALKDVGPSQDHDGDVWPTEKSLEALRASLKFDAPNGAELGTTEVFYLRIQDEDRARAKNLLNSVFGRLQERLWQIRDDRMQGLVDELEQIVRIADEDLNQATQRLTAMEKMAGEDFVELRMLHDVPNGQGDIVAAISATESEMMRWQTTREVTKNLHEILSRGARDPNALLAVPQELLASQPNLALLISGLSAAKLRTASLRGSLTEAHPRVAAAELEEQVTRQRIYEESEIALNIVGADLQLANSRIESLQQELTRLRNRLTRLAELRAGYSNLVYQVSERAKALEEAQSNLAEVRAKQAANRSGSLISRLDDPEFSSRPIGPSRKAIIGCGLVGGVFVGIGWLLLTTPKRQPHVGGPAGHATVHGDRAGVAASQGSFSSQDWMNQSGKIAPNGSDAQAI